MSAARLLVERHLPAVRLAVARAVMVVAEKVAPIAISGTSTHVVTGVPQSHVLVVGTSLGENVAALHHAAEGAKAEVFGYRVPVSVLVDDDEEDMP